MSTENNAQDPMEFMRSMWSKMGFSLPGMVTPTLDVDELDKRIADMKAVENWLKMNLSSLQMATQGLEMQRATIAAMQAMSKIASEGGRKEGVSMVSACKIARRGHSGHRGAMRVVARHARCGAPSQRAERCGVTGQVIFQSPRRARGALTSRGLRRVRERGGFCCIPAAHTRPCDTPSCLSPSCSRRPRPRRSRRASTPFLPIARRARTSSSVRRRASTP